MRCSEIPISDVCSELAQLHRLWVEITQAGIYELEQHGFAPLVPFISHRATIVHVANSDDPLEWIIQAFTSDFDALANHSYVGERFGDIPDAEYTAVIAPSLLAARDRGIPLAHAVDGHLDRRRVVYEKLTYPLHQNGLVEKLITVSRKS